MFKKVLVYSSILLSLILSCEAASNSLSFEDVFPTVFSRPSGIRLQPKAFGEAPGYQVEEFSGLDANRNHWDDRAADQGPVRFLVMHYTVCDLPATLNLFTSNISDGRASAHYVISERQNDPSVPGGLLFQMVPEEKRSWHAGVSAWKDVKNLNHASIGIENGLVA